MLTPVTRLEKFGKSGVYVNRWSAEGQRAPSETALSYLDAVPQAWGLSPDVRYPKAIVDPAEGRKRALSAYENRGF